MTSARTHLMVGRDTLLCGVLRSVFFTRDETKVTCPKCRKEQREEKATYPDEEFNQNDWNAREAR